MINLNETLEIRKATKDFVKTLVKSDQIVRKALDKFIEVKIENPTQRYGKVDKSFVSDGNYVGLMHAHLTFDKSIVYKIESGKLFLFGIYSHDDLGTGQPRNINKQKSMGIKFHNTNFE